jgi:alpha-L-glutamate ligase-like protein
MKALWSDILGLNRRSFGYLKYNSKIARRRADDKLMSKKMLAKVGVAHPRLLGVIKSHKMIEGFDWDKLVGNIVIKPVKGFGGQGILILKRSTKEKDKYILTDGRKISLDQIKMHVWDIIEGRFSHNSLPDKVMIEERIMIHPMFRKISAGGTPDVRVIVYNKVPVMAMLRLPTEESEGKANLHQGAIGLGIDMATGITTYGVYKNEPINRFPDSRKKVNGIAIPDWNKILKMSVKTQMASKLKYLSVDMLIDKDKGPVVLELNDQPGLSIQLANMSGLRKRLERVEGLSVDTPEKGVKIARALFASEFANRVKFDAVERPVVKVMDEIMLRPAVGKRVKVLVKIDTGAYSTSIDRDLAEKLGLLASKYLVMEKSFRSALGVQQRQLIAVNFLLKGVKIRTVASVSNRSHLNYQMIIGRRDLKGFLVDPISDQV